MLTDYNINNTEYIYLSECGKNGDNPIVIKLDGNRKQTKCCDKSGKIIMKKFGKIKSTGEDVYLFTIENKNGISIDLTTIGASIVAIRVPDKSGNIIDIVQGYNSAEEYTNYPVGHAGGTIGPIANKIDRGTFQLGNTKYELERNKDNGKTHCHGASEGLDTKNWKYNFVKNGIKFSLLKPDKQGGHPGNVNINVTYILTDNNELKIIYEAKTDKDTVLNLTNHSYFNLDGENNTQENSVLNHIVEIANCSKITNNNQIAVPTGEFINIEGTPFDFRKPTQVKDKINEENDQLKIGNGYDQNYCIDGYDGKKRIEAAKVKSQNTGIVLTVLTNLPGFQFYTANHLGKTTQPAGKSGKRYEKRSSLCIEPQFYPNAINTEGFEKPVLKRGEIYNREIDYIFSIE